MITVLQGLCASLAAELRVWDAEKRGFLAQAQLRGLRWRSLRRQPLGAFVRKGSLVTRHHAKERRYEAFLFERLLLLTQGSVARGYKVRRVFAINSGFIVNDFVQHRAQSDTCRKTAFLIVGGGGSSLVVHSSSEQQRQEWVRSLRRCLNVGCPVTLQCCVAHAASGSACSEGRLGSRRFVHRLLCLLLSQTPTPRLLLLYRVCV